ncbi:GGDEF domain-containing protein [Vibrio japonicus]|uniref:diguanylate cyclase n=1 Tax=Vibrio japonicus TaxID=1824638 RepID=A0ABY5LTQ0_9VIBR|nr:GGDEF domain-containing protein [Vibrio japonicus]UUM33110.1 GGDEF domain-containing protein [Vibrio japonicus]
MEALLNKISDSGLDASAVSAQEALAFWENVRQNIASTPQEEAQCLIISSTYNSDLKSLKSSIDELKQALDLLTLPGDAKLILEIKNSIAEKLVESGQYSRALNEYIDSCNIAVEHSFIDEYVFSVLGMGNLCDTYGEHNRALRYYQKIDSIDHAITSRALRLRYKLNKLACYIDLNRLSAGKNLIRECEELSILVSDKILTAQVLLYQAKIHRLERNLDLAMQSLCGIQNASRNANSTWLSNMIRMELACFLSEFNKPHWAKLLLEAADKRIQVSGPPILNLKVCDTLAAVCEQQESYQDALNYQKRAYDAEHLLIKQIPIGELGASQLRRLSRFEPQLKLILSEIENKELKETTENQKHTVEKLQQDVFTDPLTQLHNRRWLEAKLKDLLINEVQFSLMVIDIDHFKSINDELSHLVGDKAIVNVSSELASYFNFHDASCVRFGGEEFLVILENTEIEQAEAHAESFRKQIYNFNWQDILGERGLTISIGITLHKDAENTQRTFYRADKALYRAKANGRNQVCTE